MLSYTERMYIFVDLDGTLFDTYRLGVDTSVLLEKEFHINPETYEVTRQQMFEENNKVYSVRLHAMILAKRAGIDENSLVNRFIALFNQEDSSRYVYDDSFPFLKACSSLGSVIILTYGEDFVQTPRATKSGLRALVNDVIVTQDIKANIIEKYFLEHHVNFNEKIALIDDSLEHLFGVKTQFPSAITIHLVRNQAMVTPPEHYRATSLTEAFSILQKNVRD